MPKLIVSTNNGVHEIPYSPGPSVREILDAAGVAVRSGCRGNGACGLCLVRVEAGDANRATENERLLLLPVQFERNTRLACQLRPAADLRIRIVEAPGQEGQTGITARPDQPQLFDAFIKSVQYLVRLKTQQDVWDHLAKFVTLYFPAAWTAFAERDGRSPRSIVTGPGRKVRTPKGSVLANGQRG